MKATDHLTLKPVPPAERVLSSLSPDQRAETETLLAAASKVVTRLAPKFTQVLKTVTVSHEPGRFIFLWREYSPQFAAAFITAIGAHFGAVRVSDDCIHYAQERGAWDTIENKTWDDAKADHANPNKRRPNFLKKKTARTNDA